MKSYNIGLDKIKEATIAIAKMEVGLKEEELKLQEASAKTDKLIAHLNVEQEKAKKKEEEVE